MLKGAGYKHDKWVIIGYFKMHIAESISCISKSWIILKGRMYKWGYRYMNLTINLATNMYFSEIFRLYFFITDFFISPTFVVYTFVMQTELPFHENQISDKLPERNIFRIMMMLKR